MSGVSFDPPLWLQLLEVGCSTAPLLQAVLPAPLYIYPDAEWREKGSRATQLAKHPIFNAGPIAPHRMTIMDIDYDALQEPIALLEKEQSKGGPSDRWYDFHIKVLCISLDENVKELVGPVDVVIATEVVEHLEERVLNRFAPSILGNIHPKVFLLTTPNFDFNASFEPSNKYPDPTGRTNRHFRHDDHKFEWTVEEFSKWCHDVSQTHGYTVTIGGVGQDTNGPSGGGTDKYASQTAVFIRNDSKKRVDSKEVKVTCSSPKHASVDSDFSVISHDEDASFKSLHSSKSNTSAPSVESDSGFEIVGLNDGMASQEINESAASQEAPSAVAALNLDFYLPAGFVIPDQDDPQEQKQNIIDLTHNVILDTGDEVDIESAKEEKVYQSDVWSVWMNEDVRWCCQGRLDVWFDAIGVTFDEESFTCHGEIQMLVKESDLFLSIKVSEEAGDEQDHQSASNQLSDAAVKP